MTTYDVIPLLILDSIHNYYIYYVIIQRRMLCTVLLNHIVIQQKTIWSNETTQVEHEPTCYDLSQELDLHLYSRQSK